MNHFSAKTLHALSTKGIRVTGVQAIPGSGDMPWTNSEVGFLIDDNGLGMVWTFSQVLKAAHVMTPERR